MAFPPAHILIAVGFAEIVRAGVPLSRRKAWLAAAALSIAPDLDFGVGMIAGGASAYHGTFTHSVTATLVVAAVMWAGWGRRWGILGLVAYGSHILVDLLDVRGQTNVMLGWPFTSRQPMAIAKIFPTVPFEHGEGVVAAGLSLLEPHVFGRLFLQSLIGAGFCVALLLIARIVASTRRPTRAGRAIAD